MGLSWSGRILRLCRHRMLPLMRKPAVGQYIALCNPMGSGETLPCSAECLGWTSAPALVSGTGCFASTSDIDFEMMSTLRTSDSNPLIIKLPSSHSPALAFGDFVLALDSVGKL